LLDLGPHYNYSYDDMPAGQTESEPNTFSISHGT